ncbi:hypothetical protein R1sor_018206 [Riccia sorocarpa]|uniref:Uncharacterized protein n=1 Tax=Riccia sorocarpa TaxID=122646 RepID=A0ABD3ICB1_9MARC
MNGQEDETVPEVTLEDDWQPPLKDNYCNYSVSLEEYRMNPLPENSCYVMDGYPMEVVIQKDRRMTMHESIRHDRPSFTQEVAPEDPAVANGNHGRPYAMNDRRDSGTLRILAAQVSKMEELPQAREVTEIQKTSRSTGIPDRNILRSHSWYRARDEELELRIGHRKSASDYLLVNRGEGLKVIRTTGAVNRNWKGCADREDWNRTDWKEAIRQCKEIQNRLDQLHTLETTVNQRLSDSTLFVASKMAPRKPASRAIEPQ